MSKMLIVGKAFLCGVLAHGRNQGLIVYREAFQGQWFGQRLHEFSRMKKIFGYNAHGVVGNLGGVRLLAI